MKHIALAVGLICACTAARAEPPEVRVGDHQGFGRVVFDLPEQTTYHIARQGNRLQLTLDGKGTLATPATVPRNVVSIAGGDGAASVIVNPGARVQAARIGNRLIVDVLDPLPAKPRPVAASEPTSPPASTASTPIPAPATPSRAQAASSPPSAAEPSVSATSPPVPQPLATAAPELPAAAAAVPAPAIPQPKPTLDEGPLRVPATAETGAAAFRRGDLGIVVFDAPIVVAPETVASLDHFKDLTVKQTGTATVLAIPLPADQSLRLTRAAGAWAIELKPAQLAAIEEAPSPRGIRFRMSPVGRSVAVQDPVTEHVLLVGTAQQNTEPSPAVLAARTAPGYALLQTWLGVAVEPLSDKVDLQASPDGFLLSTPDAGAPARVAGAAPESRFGLPAFPSPILTQQFKAEFAEAAGLPPRARGPARVALARTMLALGMAPEAQALLTLAAVDDPAVAADPSVAGLTGIAALLAGRPEEAKGLDVPALDGSEEVDLWRGLRDVAQGKSSPQLASHLELVTAYPDAVQARILPAVAEAAIVSGQSVDLGQLMLASPRLSFARALQQQQSGQIDAALDSFDAIEKSKDQSDAVRAAIAAAELRLSLGRITPAAAAEIFERQLFAWRGDAREVAARLRLAELRTKAGAWRAALDLLRETESLFPAAKVQTQTREADVFRALLAADRESVPPLELVQLAGEFADIVKDGPAAETLASLLADKLLALDLPDRASPVLQSLMDKSVPGPVRAEFGTKLAQLHLDAGAPEKAEAALRASDATGLSEERMEARTLLLAKARAAQGDLSGAAHLLTALGSPSADDLRAKLYARSGDWHESFVALRELSAKTVPRTGELSEQQQDLVLQEVTAAAQAGDDAAVRDLSAFQPRLTGARADVFRALTAPSVQKPEDLPRAARELAMSRALPGRVEALTRR